LKKVVKKRSTQHTLDRENGSSAARPFKEGVVEGSFGTGKLKGRCFHNRADRLSRLIPVTGFRDCR